MTLNYTHCLVTLDSQPVNTNAEQNFLVPEMEPLQCQVRQILYPTRPVLTKAFLQPATTATMCFLPCT